MYKGKSFSRKNIHIWNVYVYNMYYITQQGYNNASSQHTHKWKLSLNQHLGIMAIKGIADWLIYTNLNLILKPSLLLCCLPKFEFSSKIK